MSTVTMSASTSQPFATAGAFAQAGPSSFRGSDVHMFGTTPMSLRDLVVECVRDGRSIPADSRSSMFDQATPTPGAHFNLLGTSVKSEGGRFDKIEADFCTNYTCCNQELDDMHGLLEHFESNHLSGGPATTGANEQLTAIAEAAVEGIDGLASDDEGREKQMAAMKRRALQDFAASVRENEAKGGNRPRPPVARSGYSFPGGPREVAMSPLATAYEMSDMDSDVDTMELGDDGTSDDNAGYASLSDAESIGSNRSFASALGNLRLRRPTERNTSPPSPGQAPNSASAALEPAVAGSGTGTITPSQLTSLPPEPAQALPPPAPTGGEADGTAKNLNELLQRTGLPEGFTPPPPSLPSGRVWVAPANKPFKCPVPGCDKAYKQQNGLKYHKLHGHCNNRARVDSACLGFSLTLMHVGEGNPVQTDGRETLEMKPYGCYVGAACGKRYKNMNGLRYVRQPCLRSS